MAICGLATKEDGSKAKPLVFFQRVEVLSKFSKQVVVAAGGIDNAVNGEFAVSTTYVFDFDRNIWLPGTKYVEMSLF